MLLRSWREHNGPITTRCPPSSFDGCLGTYPERKEVKLQERQNRGSKGTLRCDELGKKGVLG